MTVSRAATLRKSQMFAACWDIAQHRLIIILKSTRVSSVSLCVFTCLPGKLKLIFVYTCTFVCLPLWVNALESAGGVYMFLLFLHKDRLYYIILCIELQSLVMILHYIFIFIYYFVKLSQYLVRTVLLKTLWDANTKSKHVYEYFAYTQQINN